MSKPRNHTNEMYDDALFVQITCLDWLFQWAYRPQRCPKTLCHWGKSVLNFLLTSSHIITVFKYAIMIHYYVSCHVQNTNTWNVKKAKSDLQYMKQR
jgi:hypothetical protein